MIKSQRSLVALLLIAGLGSACCRRCVVVIDTGASDDPDLGFPSAEPDPFWPADVQFEVGAGVTAAIGPEGGSITATGAGGVVFTLDVPPLALFDAVALAVRPMTTVSGLPSGSTNVHGAVLEPEGQYFRLPVTLSVEGVPGQPEAFGFGYAGSELHLAPALTEPGRVVKRLLHFSGSGVASGLTTHCDSPLIVSPPGEALAKHRLRCWANRYPADGAQLTPTQLSELEKVFDDWMSSNGILFELESAKTCWSDTTACVFPADPLLNRAMAHFQSWLGDYQLFESVFATNPSDTLVKLAKAGRVETAAALKAVVATMTERCRSKPKLPDRLVDVEYLQKIYLIIHRGLGLTEWPELADVMPVEPSILCGSLTVSPSLVTLEVGQQFPLTGGVIDTDGNMVPLPSSAKWESGDLSVAQVDSDGIVFPLALGTTTITLHVEGATAAAEIKIASDAVTIDWPFGVTSQPMEWSGTNISARVNGAVGEDYTLRMEILQSPGAASFWQYETITSTGWECVSNGNYSTRTVSVGEPAGWVTVRASVRLDGTSYYFDCPPDGPILAESIMSFPVVRREGGFAVIQSIQGEGRVSVSSGGCCVRKTLVPDPISALVAGFWPIAAQPFVRNMGLRADAPMMVSVRLRGGAMFETGGTEWVGSIGPIETTLRVLF